jgi:uncharacterized protein (DUF305 family)
MVGVSFVAMYLLMYAMVNTIDNVVMNFNQFYMAGLMAAPMALIEVAVMGGMYENRRANRLIVGAAGLATVAFFLCIRRQTAIGEGQFLRSMIPHHASAILMCEQADTDSSEIKRLCEAIVSSQRDEITRMKKMLEARCRLDSRVRQ